MKLLDFEFERFKLSECKTDKKNLEVEIEEIFQICNLKIPERKIDLYNSAMQHITNVKYSSGGYGVFRGYYCPSIYKTFTIGGYHRGKLLKRITSKSKVAYEFCYEGENLILVKSYNDYGSGADERKIDQIEFIERRGDIEIGIQLAYDLENNQEESDESQIIHICQYDNNRLLNVRMLWGNIESYQYEKEWMQYKKEVLTSIKFLNFEQHPMDFLYDLSTADITTLEEYATDSSRELLNIDGKRQQYLQLDTIEFGYDATGCPTEYFYKDDESHTYSISKENRQYYIEELSKR